MAVKIIDKRFGIVKTIPYLCILIKTNIMTTGQLIELLNAYPKDFVITNEQNQPFIHMTNGRDNVILSTTKPIGYCNRSGEYVYPSVVEGYSAYSPELDEDLYDMEWTPLTNMNG